jgi:prepilin-type N-terminal cleavage/methylation domain-containing protein
MRLAHTTKPRRSAFTLVELLVVIMIIVVLVALTAGTVFKALERGAEVQNRNGITQLSNGVAAFKTKFGRIPPSRIRLCRNVTTYANSPSPAAAGGAQLDQDSIAFIHAMFPRCDAQWASQAGIQWSQVQGWTGDTTLEGEQCLVFFLGGIPANPNGTNGGLGFSSNPADPSNFAGSTSPIASFVNFEPSRLTFGQSFGQSNPYFFVYNDPYDTPYVYFSSYNARNGYPRYGTAVSDCAAFNVFPYIQNVNQNVNPPITTFWNPDSFQIISAGRNGQKQGGGFGPGGLWTPANAGAIGAAGADDISNFYDQVLGHASSN